MKACDSYYLSPIRAILHLQYYFAYLIILYYFTNSVSATAELLSESSESPRQLYPKAGHGKLHLSLPYWHETNLWLLLFSRDGQPKEKDWNSPLKSCRMEVFPHSFYICQASKSQNCLKWNYLHQHYC